MIAGSREGIQHDGFHVYLGYAAAACKFAEKMTSTISPKRRQCGTQRMGWQWSPRAEGISSARRGDNLSSGCWRCNSRLVSPITAPMIYCGGSGKLLFGFQESCVIELSENYRPGG